MKLLIIEDDEHIRRAHERMFRILNVDVALVATGEDALAKFAAGYVPDAVVSDHDLGPGINGIELARMIRGLWPKIPFLLNSGNLGVEGQAQDLGIEFLPKPASLRSKFAYLGL